jgi:hypothetical protein
MNFKTTLSSILTILMVGGVFLLVNQNTSQFQADAVAVGDNMRRIYVYPENELSKDSWNDDVLNIHYTGGSSSSTYATAPAMILAVGDYYLGLLYYDIPADSTTFMIQAEQNTNNLWQQSVNVTLNDGNKFLGFKLINDYEGGKVKIFQENIIMSSAQFTGILSKIDSCGAGYASGYNSYEYLIRTFVKKADGTNIMGTSEQNLFPTTRFADMNDGFVFSIDGTNRTANNTSVSEKLTILQRQFNANVDNTDINYI